MAAPYAATCNTGRMSVPGIRAKERARKARARERMAKERVNMERAIRGKGSTKISGIMQEKGAA